MFETVTIAGVECLCRFDDSGDCLKMDLVIATDTGLVSLGCLVPHGLEELECGAIVYANYKDAVIRTLNKWFDEGLIKPSDYTPDKFRYTPTFRGYADLWNPKKTIPISTVNLVDFHCQSASVTDILRGRKEAWMSDAQHEEFTRRCESWKQSNQGYLQQKAKDFATFWSKRVGTLGTSGDVLIDAMAAWTKSHSQVTYLADSDTEKFFLAVYNWAIARFAEGRIPFLDTDYSPSYELRQLLVVNKLSHLSEQLPMKTWMHLNFDDMDRGALFGATVR